MATRNAEWYDEATSSSAVGLFDLPASQTRLMQAAAEQSLKTIVFLGLPKRENFGLYICMSTDSATRPKVKRIVLRDDYMGKTVPNF